MSFESEQCNVWFDHSKKKRNLEFFLPDLDLEDDASSKDSSRSENLEGRSKKVSDSEESRDRLLQERQVGRRNVSRPVIEPRKR